MPRDGRDYIDKVVFGRAIEEPWSRKGRCEEHCRARGTERCGSETHRAQGRKSGFVVRECKYVVRGIILHPLSLCSLCASPPGLLRQARSSAQPLLQQLSEGTIPLLEILRQSFPLHPSPSPSLCPQASVPFSLMEVGTGKCSWCCGKRETSSWTMFVLWRGGSAEQPLAGGCWGQEQHVCIHRCIVAQRIGHAAR